MNIEADLDLSVQFFKEKCFRKSENVLSFHNHFHNILRLFDVLSNFPFTTSEMMREYYL